MILRVDAGSMNAGERDVLIRVRAVSLNAADWRMMRGDPFLARLYSGLLRPKRITTLGAGVTVSSKPNRADLELLSDLLAQGKIRSVTDRRYPLEQSAEAMQYLEAGHAAGKIIVTV